MHSVSMVGKHTVCLGTGFTRIVIHSLHCYWISGYSLS